MTETHWYRAYVLKTRDRGEIVAQIEFDKYRVLKHTEKGVWLKTGWGADEKKFVLRNARKRYAAPTKEEALESLRRRKQIELDMLKRRIPVIEDALEQLEDIDLSKLRTSRLTRVLFV